jgi:hypothetical protein
MQTLFGRDLLAWTVMLAAPFAVVMATLYCASFLRLNQSPSGMFAWAAGWLAGIGGIWLLPFGLRGRLIAGALYSIVAVPLTAFWVVAGVCGFFGACF